MGLPREGRSQAVAGIPFTLEKQRNAVGSPAGAGSTSCGWAQWPGQGYSIKVQLQLAGSWPSRQRNKAMELGCLLTSQSSSPFTLGVRLWNVLPTNLRTGATDSLFSPSKGRTMWLVPGSGVQGGLCRSLRSPLPGGPSNLEDSLVTSAHPTPTHCCYTDRGIRPWCTAVTFHRFGAPPPSASPVGLAPWNWGNRMAGEARTFPFSTTPQGSQKTEVQESYKTCELAPPTVKW